jgi:hypothetical protein
MDQNPPPLESLQVADRAAEPTDVVLELTKPTGAVEAEYPPDRTRPLIVVHMLGIGLATDGIHVTLRPEYLSVPGFADSVYECRPEAFASSGRRNLNALLTASARRGLLETANPSGRRTPDRARSSS